MADSTLEDIAEGALTDATIRQMFRLIDRAKTDQSFQKFVYGIVGRAMHGVWKQYRQELQTVFDWFRSKHDYRRDPVGVELLHDVWATMDRGRFDCDDSSIWLGAAAEVLGSPVRFVTVSTRPDKRPVHVYVQAKVGGHWLSMDATVPGSSVGWEPTLGITDRKVWTRQTVGLAGEDEEMIDGYDVNALDPFFQGSLVKVQGEDEGVPDDVAKTWAAPHPGELMISKRLEVIPPVAQTSERPENERSGGGIYNPQLPVGHQPTPRELFTTIPQDQVPLVLNPREDFWGGTGVLLSTLDSIFPHDSVPEQDYARGAVGLGELVPLADLQGAVLSGLGYGVEEDLLEPDLLGDAIHALFDRNHPLWNHPTFPQVARGIGQEVRQIARHHGRRKHHEAIRDRLDVRRPHPAGSFVEATHMLGNIDRGQGHHYGELYQAVYDEVARQLPAAFAEHGIDARSVRWVDDFGNPVGFSGLGDAATDAAQAQAIMSVAQSVTATVAGVVAPGDQKAIQDAVGTAVGAVVGAAPKTPSDGILGMKWSTVIPLAAVAAVALVGFASSRTGGRRYKRNPKRSGGIEAFVEKNQTILLLLGAGAVGYYFFTKTPGLAPKPAVPQAQSSLVSSLAQGAAGIATAIAGLFKPSAPAPTTSRTTSPIVTSIPGVYGAPSAPSSEPVPGMITSFA